MRKHPVGDPIFATLPADHSVVEPPVIDRALGLSAVGWVNDCGTRLEALTQRFLPDGSCPKVLGRTAGPRAARIAPDPIEAAVAQEDRWFLPTEACGDRMVQNPVAGASCRDIVVLAVGLADQSIEPWCIAGCTDAMSISQNGVEPGVADRHE